MTFLVFDNCKNLNQVQNKLFHKINEYRLFQKTIYFVNFINWLSNFKNILVIELSLNQLLKKQEIS